MGIASTVLMFLLWLVVIPFLTGIIPGFVFEKSRKRIGTIYLAGWVFMAAIFQLVSVPYIIAMKTFSEMENVYSIVIVAWTIISAIVLIIMVGTNSLTDFVELPRLKKVNGDMLFCEILFLILVALQIYMSITWMTADGDDSYYVTHAVIADYEDKMYMENPYTGEYNNLEYRHVLAPFSMFIAFFARKLTIHATIMAHTVLPPVFIVISYLIYYKICQALLPNENEKQPIFMIIICGLQIFGGTSLYTKEVFFLTRTWQGKSVLANIVIPFAFYLMLQLCRQTQKGEEHRYRLVGIFILLFLTNLFGALTSSLGLLLLLIAETVMFVLISIRNKKIGVIIGGLPCLLPCFAYMILYIILR